MITFMITYEIRMDCQVTFIALVFFQDCSKYGNIMQHKDVLVSRPTKKSNDFSCNRIKYSNYYQNLVLLFENRNRYLLIAKSLTYY